MRRLLSDPILVICKAEELSLQALFEDHLVRRPQETEDAIGRNAGQRPPECTHELSCPASFLI